MLSEHARHIQGNVAVADDRDGRRLERPLAWNIGVAVVPAHEVGSAIAARQVDSGDHERGIPNRTGREDHGVVMLLQVGQGDVTAEVHVAEKADVARIEHIS